MEWSEQGTEAGEAGKESERGRQEKDMPKGMECGSMLSLYSFCFLVKGSVRLLLLIGASGVGVCVSQKWDGTSRA